MPKRWKNYRKIVVAEFTLRWRTDFHSVYQKFSRSYAESGESWEPDKLIVRLEEDPNRLFTVIWPACTAPPAITPRMVATYSEHAIELGWPREKPDLTINGTNQD